MIIKDFKILEKMLRPRSICNLYHFKPIEGFSIDSRSIREKEAFIAIKGQYKDGHTFIQEAVNKGACFIVAEKYVPTKPLVSYFIVEDAYSSLKEINIYLRKILNPFVYAVTGSIGKTTTKDMLHFLIEGRFRVLKNKGTENNFLGVTKTIFSLEDEKVLVLELGTNAKGEIESLAKISMPDVGIITFIKPVHLEGLKSLRGIFEEKISLLKGNPKIKAVLNLDDYYLSKIKDNKNIYWFGSDKKNDLFFTLQNRKNGSSIFLLQNKYRLEVPSYLEGFIANYSAAILGAHLLGISLNELAERMSTFRNYSPMRVEIKELADFSVLNDAYNANPYAVSQALKNLKHYPSPKIAILGDMLELGKRSVYYHKQLAPHIIKSNFDYCLTFGEYSQHTKGALEKLGYRKAFHFSSHKEIAQFIRKKVFLRKHFDKRYLIFLKGSRKMGLEKVLEYL